MNQMNENKEIFKKRLIADIQANRISLDTTTALEEAIDLRDFVLTYQYSREEDRICYTDGFNQMTNEDFEEVTGILSRYCRLKPQNSIRQISKKVTPVQKNFGKPIKMRR